MKKLLKVLSVLIMTFITIPELNAQIVQKIEFDSNDYLIRDDSNGYSTLFSKSEDYHYAETSGPCIPLKNVSIAIPYLSGIEDIKIEYGEISLIKENIMLSTNPKMIPVGSLSTKLSKIEEIKEATIIFPNSNCEFTGCSTWQGIPMASFEISPFRYDASKKELFFINDITISISLNEKESNSKLTEDIEEVRGIAKNMVLNPDCIDGILSQMPSSTPYFKDTIEYLLVTTDDLLPAFERLINWKKTKGIYAVPVTINQIESWYEGNDIQEKIKHCLYDAYLSYGLKYAVLGGDVDIVPSRRCYAATGDVKYTDMAVDKYYSCFGGNFEWNENKNSLFGERDDNIDFSENIYVTRISVSTKTEADTYVDKLISYETGTNSDFWDESILTMGIRIKRDSTDSPSDAEISGDLFYNKYIAPYWDGRRVRYYDTATDFEGNEQYDVRANNMQEQLSKNHMFISMYSHGGKECWEVEHGPYYYNSDAKSLIRKASSIITTISCLTNAFDLDDMVGGYSLSEGFIRGKDNGVVGYWGSSREGWVYTYSLGLSTEYEGCYYRYLFGKSPENKNFGKLISLARTEMIGNCRFSSYRMLQKSMNALGDAEMPVFTHKPKKFDNIQISFNQNNIEVNTGIDDCRICVMSTEDWGDSFYEVVYNTSSASFSNLPDKYSITVTKQGFKPFVYGIVDYNSNIIHGLMQISDDHLSLQNPSSLSLDNRNDKLIFASETYDQKIGSIKSCNVCSDKLIVTVDISNSIQREAKLVVSDIYGQIICTHQVSEDINEISNCPSSKGIYFVTLVVDELPIDSARVLN